MSATQPDAQRRDFITSTLGGLALILSGWSRAAAPPVASTQQAHAGRIGRRIVTGVDEQGRSGVTWEGSVPANAMYQSAKTETVDFWVARRLPAPVDDSADPMLGWEMADRAPSGGVLGRLFTWAPGVEYPLHSTPTLDFIIVVSGQLELRLETTSRTLGPGDVVVQRRTRHGWGVVGDTPCTFVGIMLDA